MASEKYLERKLHTKVEALGGWSLKLLPTFITGLPDRLCLFPGGRAAFAEIKTSGKQPKPIQKTIHNKLRRLGFTVAVIDDIESLEEFLLLYSTKP